MKYLPLYLLLYWSFGPILGQDYKNVFLLDNWFVDTLVSGPGDLVFNETWGFVQDQREYAVIGSTEGTHFFEITDQDKLNPVGFIRGKFSSPQVIHRDFHDYAGYLYAVCDEGSSSLQIIDLQFLPDSVVIAHEDSTSFGRVHNIFIDSSSALLYACTFTPIESNPSLQSTSMKVFSLTDPLNPQEVFGGFEHISEVHDAYVVNDTAYLNCGFDGLHIYNFANPTNPVLIGSKTVYQDQGYNHSGWLSPNKETYYFVDETAGKRIKKVDVTDPSNPSISALFGTNWLDESTAHNIMVTDDLIFAAYYGEGFRVFDTRFQPPKEVAHYDTYDTADPLSSMNGAWGVYAFLPSKRLLVSDMKNGLFLFDFDINLFSIVPSKLSFNVFPNPASSGQEVVFRFNDKGISKIRFYLYDNLGKLIHSVVSNHQDYWTVKLPLASGSYNYTVYYEDYLGDQTLKQGRLIVLD